MMDTVTIKVEHEVDLGSDEAFEIYKAIVDGLLSGSYINLLNPLKLRYDEGAVQIAWVDVDSDVYGGRPLADAVSELMVFADTFNGDDSEFAGKEAIAIADEFERQAKLLKARAAEIAQRF